MQKPTQASANVQPYLLFDGRWKKRSHSTLSCGQCSSLSAKR